MTEASAGLNRLAVTTSAGESIPVGEGFARWVSLTREADTRSRHIYFNGNGAAGHLTILLLWTAFGLGAIVIGHHTSIRFAAAR